MEQEKTQVNSTSFSAWVSDPSGISFSDSKEIESMAGNFPYCQILQSLNAKSAQEKPEFDSLLARAALYSPDRRVLFTLINHPERMKIADAAIADETEGYYEIIEDDDYAADLVSHEAGDEIQPAALIIDEKDSAGPVEAEEKVSAKSGKEMVNMNDREEEEKTIIENIAATDFFTFDEKLNVIPTDPKENLTDKQQPLEQSPSNSQIIEDEPATEIIAEADSNEIARYDDDSMPYSFLWWLHKTRKEHADTYQPYVDFKLDTNRSIKRTSGPELNQQMIENIFHLQSPLDEMAEKPMPQTVHFDLKRKEEEIIERFIREEPQINPPSAEKLDLENKARKSAEDPNDLVSETLAAIYTEQMLFHKAIDTYQKLSLKFPEKKAYFADQISELQKKIN